MVQKPKSVRLDGLKGLIELMDALMDLRALLS